MSAPVKHGLLRHYDAKYEAEAGGTPADLVSDSPVPRDRFEACIHHLPRFFRGGDVLELAAGSGRVASTLLAGGLGCSSYTLSEFSEARLEGLRREIRDPRARVAALDAEDLPESESGRYDAVLMVALIEHLVDPLRAMQGVRRLLRPGGFVYVDTPNVAKWTRRLKLLFGRFPATASRDEGLLTYAGAPTDLHDEGHLHYFTYRSLGRMLTQRCGFSRVEPLAYASSRLLGARLDHALASARPQLFSEVCLVAFA
jgi:SAM-dependent methyltransferase